MCPHDMRQCQRYGAPRAAAWTAVLLALFTPSQSFSRPCTALRGAGGNGLARARPRAATAGLAMSGGPPKIDPRTGLPEGYEPPKLNKAQEAMIKRVLEKSKNSNKMKRVEFKSSATAAAKVNDTGVGDNATLDTYFNLPAEQWVTLDDRYISRLDAPDDNRNAVQYRFTLPLKHFMQIPLTATCDVSVIVDEKSRLLRLEATGAKLREATEEDDAMPAPNLTLANSTTTKLTPPTLPPNFTQSIQQAAMEVGFKTRVQWQPQSTGWMGGAVASQLKLKTEVEVAMTLPPPFSFLPSFVLHQAGGLVLKAACTTILPRFGELVADDYRRWSRGEPRVGGSLAPAPKTLEQLEGSPYYFPPPSQPTGLPPPSVGSSSSKEN